MNRLKNSFSGSSSGTPGMPPRPLRWVTVWVVLMFTTAEPRCSTSVVKSGRLIPTLGALDVGLEFAAGGAVLLAALLSGAGEQPSTLSINTERSRGFTLEVIVGMVEATKK